MEKSIPQLIETAKQGDSASIVELSKRFIPLVIKWLKKTGEWYGNEKDDYQSIAKIILVESIKEWESKRGVPFQSYYKIRLWNWYGNHKKKKEVEQVALGDYEAYEMGSEMEVVEQNEQKKIFFNALEILNEEERKIIMRTYQNFTIRQISEELKLEPKKVSQIKHRAMTKLKRHIISG